MAAKKKSKTWYVTGLFQPDGTVKEGKVAEPLSGKRKLIGSLKRLLNFHRKDSSVSPLSEHAKNMMRQFGVAFE